MKILLLALIMFSTACKSTDDSSESSQSLMVAEEYMDLVNAHRATLGLKRLVYSPDIEQRAEDHSLDMANKIVPFGHTGSSLRCGEIRKALGGGNLCGEVVAMGQDNARQVFEAWLNSPGHRSKIEGSRYTHTGMGYKLDSQGKIYWTQIFLEIQ